jgi:ATP-dependent DNA helicase RecG
MELDELRQRIRGGENLHTDFKAQTGSADELAKDIVCFSNADGGQIIVGVSAEGTIVGLGGTDEINRFVDNIALNNCEPPVTVVQEVLEEAGKKVVVIHVPKGSQRPYRTNRGRYYVRTSSGCRDASREELLRLFQAVGSLYYDETPLPRLGLQDLDLDAFQEHMEGAGLSDLGLEPERLLRNLGLMAGDHPTIAGLVLFGKDPQRHLPFAQINAARFPGTDSSAAPSDRKDLRGRLLDVIHQTQQFLGLHLKTPHEIRGFKPEREPELPEEALREAIVNAVVHRDYTVQGPVRLFVLDDRVEVHTPGKAPNTVTEEAMRAGVHVPRNPRILTRLSDAGLVTRAGTGVRRMSKLVREASGRDIGIDLRDYEVLVTLPRPPPAGQPKPRAKAP